MTFLLLLAECVMLSAGDQQSPAEPPPPDLPVSVTRSQERLQTERTTHRTRPLAEFCALHDCAVLERELEGSTPEGILMH